VFRTTNGGTGWRPFNASLTTTEVTELAIGASGRILFAGTDGGGVFDYRFR
jgi:hypothetical protein